MVFRKWLWLMLTRDCILGWGHSSSSSKISCWTRNRQHKLYSLYEWRNFSVFPRVWRHIASIHLIHWRFWKEEWIKLQKHGFLLLEMRPLWKRSMYCFDMAISFLCNWICYGIASAVWNQALVNRCVLLHSKIDSAFCHRFRVNNCESFGGHMYSVAD